MIIVVKGPINDKPAVVQIIHDNSLPEPMIAYFTGGLSEITNEPFYDMISVYLFFFTTETARWGRHSGCFSVI